MNNSIEFITMRDRELFEAYRSALRRSNIRSHKEAIQAAINTTTSRFWISPFQAYRCILKLQKGQKPGMRGIRQKMINDLYNVFSDMSNNRREFKGCSTYFIVGFAVNHSAPGFYISYHRASAIISRMNRERRYER